MSLPSYNLALETLSKEQLLKLIDQLVHRLGDEVGGEIVSSFLGVCVDSSIDIVGCADVALTASGSVLKGLQKPSKQPREFDMSKYRTRHIALLLQYDGGAYYGFAAQPEGGGADDTVEKQLFAALTKIKLISDRKTCQYTRCGRTDRGVSALGQVISLTVRSAFPKDVKEDDLPSHPSDWIELPEKNGGTRRLYELDYCNLLNRALPEDIRAIAWTSVVPDFNARFSATYRTYRYFFLKRNLALDRMAAAAELLVGEHDFRNLAKLDVLNVSNFVRTIHFAHIISFDDHDKESANAVYMLEIQGNAFLWHMIRCIMAILFLVGEGKEEPTIVSQLLDLSAFNARPNYLMAPDAPLVLHECGYENTKFVFQPRVLEALTSHFEALENRHLIAAARARNALRTISIQGVRLKDVVLHNSSLVKEISPSSSSSGCTEYDPAVKRLKVSNLASVNDNFIMEEMIDWASASSIARCRSREKDSLAHVKLADRPRYSSYESKCSNLPSTKQQHLKRNLELRLEAKVNDPDFHKTMQKLGSSV